MNALDPRLLLVVLLAFAVESSLGFGSAVVTVALASSFTTINELLAAFVPLNVVLSLYLVSRYRSYVDVRLLLRRMLPAMVLGMPFGLLALRVLDPLRMRAAFGLFVFLLSIFQLARLLRKSAVEPPPLGVAPASALLFLSGIIHGAFVTGGPLAVYVLGRELGADKGSFRATLSALWLVLNLLLLASYAYFGTLSSASFLQSASLVVPMVVGIVVGEWAHRKIAVQTFTIIVYALLTGAGAMLLYRAVR